MKFLASPLPFDVTGILLNYPINDDKKCNYKCIPQQSFTTYPASLPPKSHHTVRPPRRRVSFQSIFCALSKACHVLSHAMWGHGDDPWVTSKKTWKRGFFWKSRSWSRTKWTAHGFFLNLAIHVWREWSEIISDLIQLENEIKLKNDIKNHMRCALLNRKWLWCSQRKFICTSGRKF